MMRRVLAALLLMGVSLEAQVSFDRLLRADREPQNWLSYSGTGSMTSQRPERWKATRWGPSERFNEAAVTVRTTSTSAATRHAPHSGTYAHG